MVAGAGLVTIGSSFVGDVDGWRKGFFIGLALIGGCVNVAVPPIEQVKRDRAHARVQEDRRRELVKAEKAAADMRTAMINAFGPIAYELGVMWNADKGKRDRYHSSIVKSILEAVAQITKHSDDSQVRASFYRLENGSPRSLQPVQFVGRFPGPRTVFVEDTDKGRHMFDVLYARGAQAKGYDLVENFDISPPEGWDPNGGGPYKTYIAAPVIVGKVPCGMLFVDTLKPGELTLIDATITRFFAMLTGAVLADDKKFREFGKMIPANRSGEEAVQ
ncbi:hypothetical protein [Actinopolymorpha cephalotaxi]|nr:hypothetical protein [Actinopolymorpha cephalotaxi]NYH87348.1 hypothetical protein [Actinopolymorpha cephalotaxi]